MAQKNKPGNIRSEDDSVSLNKYISDSGFCSRRDADEYIEQERVSINNVDANKGNRVYPGDVVRIDGEPIRKKVKTLYIAFNKPAGITCTTDTNDKTNIIDFLRHPQRIFPIGRLDKDSEGLIFLTNDGDIVNKILRAGNNHEKEYIVSVDKPISTDFIRQMGEGVKILGTWTKPTTIKQESKYSFRIILTQGLNRQIRRMCEALEYKVTKLVRIRIMNVPLGKLPTGHWRYLTPDEMIKLNHLVATSSKTEEASVVKRPRPVKKAAPQPAEKPKEKEAPSFKTKGKPTDAPKSGKPGAKGNPAANGKPRPQSEGHPSKSTKTFKEYRKSGRKR